MSRSPPLRFLILLLAVWSGFRAALLAPPWRTPPAGAGDRWPGDSAAAHPPAAPSRRSAAAASPARVLAIRTTSSAEASRPRALPMRPSSAAGPQTHLTWQLAPSLAAHRARPADPARPSPTLAPARATPRWSLAVWTFLRGGDAAPLAAGGTLGGSQAAARLSYRLNDDSTRPLALAARLTSPLRRPAGAEAALGLDWQPSRRLPIHLLAERRQRLGREGRSAFGLTVYGGVSDARAAGLRVDAYAQAGLVGARSLDPFADGALRLSLPFGRARFGAGAWAAAQPGVARLDLGPQASLRLPLAGRNVTVAADWRQRLAGDARPGSGPTLTLSTDF